MLNTMLHTTLKNQKTNEVNVENFVGQSVFIQDHNSLYQEYKIVDQPRDGLLEIRLKADNRFITHISTKEIYKQFGKSIIHRVVSLKNLDNSFAILGSGLYSLV